MTTSSQRNALCIRGFETGKDALPFDRDIECHEFGQTHAHTHEDKRKKMRTKERKDERQC